MKQICCLALRGDFSSSPSLVDYFDTADEFTDFLRDEKNKYFWRNSDILPIYNNTPVNIAINF